MSSASIRRHWGAHSMRRSRIAWLGLLGLHCGLNPAVGEDAGADGGVPDLGFLAWETACEQLYDLDIRRDARCSLAPEVYFRRIFSNTCTIAEVRLSMGTRKYDPSAASRCLAASANRGCSDQIDPACDDMLTGALGLGVSCLQGDCTPDLRCDPISCTCQPPPTPVPGRKLGEACSRAPRDDCQYPLFCYSETASVAPSCRAYPDIGESCLDGGICDLLRSYCSASTGRCTPFPKSGEPCVEFGYCLPAARCDGQVCADPGGIGAPCDPHNYFCALGLVCRDGACDLPLLRGSTCTSTLTFAQCEPPDYCDSQTQICTKRRTLGEVCSDYDACEGNLRCLTVCRPPGPTCL